MLIANLYTVNSNEVQNTIQKVSITLNPECDVFKGHFPNKPVTPGVCMLQIVKELTEERVGKSLFMKKIANVKFMAVINPEEITDLIITNDFTDSEKEVKIKCVISYDNTIALKVVIYFLKL